MCGSPCPAPPLPHSMLSGRQRCILHFVGMYVFASLVAVVYFVSLCCLPSLVLFNRLHMLLYLNAITCLSGLPSFVLFNLLHIFSIFMRSGACRACLLRTRFISTPASTPAWQAAVISATSLCSIARSSREVAWRQPVFWSTMSGCNFLIVRELTMLCHTYYI